MAIGKKLVGFAATGGSSAMRLVSPGRTLFADRPALDVAAVYRRGLPELQRREEADKREALEAEVRRHAAVVRIRALVDSSLPPAATVAVISRGDPELVNLDGREAWHFPRTRNGEYAGFHPADGHEAVRHLGELRRQGARFLLIPSTALWWLDHYPEFAAHLRQECRIVAYDEGTAALYVLEPGPGEAGPASGKSASAATSLPAPSGSTILFAGHDLRFIRPYVAYSLGCPDREVLIDHYRGHVPRDTGKSSGLSDRAGIVFAEWGLGNAVWYSRNKRPRQTLVVRVHRQELELPFLDQIAWTEVDLVIFVSPAVMDEAILRIPDLGPKSALIPNPIDCDSLQRRRMARSEFNLGVLGYCPRRKLPHRSLETFSSLAATDARYTLTFRGRGPRDLEWLWTRPKERRYYEDFEAKVAGSPYRDRIRFEPYDDDVAEWFARTGYLLSTSENEGSHQAVAEAMAAGTIPVVWNWPGADRIYPEPFIVAGIDDAVGFIGDSLRGPAREAMVARAREFARARFHYEPVIRALDEAISRVSGNEEKRV
jgi:glycosyltransferase involved in cell wall biosynthesis